MNKPIEGTQSAGTDVLDALVIGAGFSGLYQLYCLREKLGLHVKVMEAGGGVGGTWYWNRYPGARCDSESQVYCYTFSKELTQDWNWSERYPGTTEIVSYLEHVAERFALNRDIAFNTRVTAAQFDEAAKHWVIETLGATPQSLQTYRAKFLITAVGCLSSANVPDIEGLDEFNGEWYHTGQWPHQGVDFSGKRVGQIGTGSTGIQAAPVIAETARHLTVFQRTANYSIPARNYPLTDDTRRAHKKNATTIREITRSNANGHGWHISDQEALKTPPQEQQAAYTQAWENGGLKFRATFKDLLSSEEANATAAQFICNKIRETVKDPETAEALATIDHPYGAKRPPIDTRYFETFNQDHVTLVDLRNTPIRKITAEGVMCGTTGPSEAALSEQHHDLDVIVFATGYDAITGTLLKIDIRGRKGLPLRDAWCDGPRNHLGLQAAGFPNFFMVTGPGSPSVLTNMPAAIEQHVEWISDCIEYMIEHQHSTIESPESSVDKWVEHANEAANKTLLPKVKHSWYLGANIPGKPRIFMPYAGGLDQYRKRCNAVATAGYEGFVFED